MTSAAAPVPHRELVRDRNFLSLLVTQGFDEAASQIARLALAFITLARTGSALWTAAAFAVSFIPTVLGPAVLGPLSDRLSCRSVLLVSDLARAAIVGFLALVAVSTSPLWVLFLLLFLAELFTPASEAARSHSIRQVLGDAPRVAGGLGISRTVALIGRVVGLVVGGAVIGIAASRSALVLSAACFLVAAVVTAVAVPRLPIRLEAGASVTRLLADAKAGRSELRADPARRSLLLLAVAGSLAAFTPEALALPYAARAGARPLMGAVLVACVVAGAAIGSLLISRRKPRRQAELLLPLALGSGLVLLLVAPAPPVVVLVVLWLIAGLMQAYLVPCTAFLGMLGPEGGRPHVAALTSVSWAVAAVVSFLVAGGVAQLTSPAFAVVACASLSLVLILLATHNWAGRELRQSVSQLQRAGRAPTRVESADEELVQADDSGVMRR